MAKSRRKTTRPYATTKFRCMACGMLAHPQNFAPSRTHVMAVKQYVFAGRGRISVSDQTLAPSALDGILRFHVNALRAALCHLTGMTWVSEHEAQRREQNARLTALLDATKTSYPGPSVPAKIPGGPYLIPRAKIPERT